MKIKLLQTMLLITIVIGLVIPYQPVLAAKTIQFQEKSLDGWFSILWGDGEDGSTAAQQYLLETEAHGTVNLMIGEELIQTLGGVLHLAGKKVSVAGEWLLTPEMDGQFQPFMVTSYSLVDNEINNLEVSPLVSGSQPWVSIMCKFSDYSQEPKNLAYFQGMYASSWPGLNHYWQEVSYNTVNVLGSTAVGWFTLPQPRSYYVYNNALDFGRAANDCTGVANASVNFSTFIGINLMFNADLDGYAWGGGHYMTLDGITKVWRMTWEPPWGYSAITVIAHEMGHGFGLPHSSGPYGQTYDNRWDVMSDTWTDCNNSKDPTYGCLGQHTIAYHKDILGWIPAGQKFNAGSGTSMITLEQLAVPQSGNYKMAKIPIGGSSTHFYTVEVRRKTGYDVKLPGQAVIIHDVDTTRSRPAYIVDPDNNGNTGDAGAMWLAGETFSNSAFGISITINAATSTGFQVTIATPPSAPGAFSKTSPANGAVGSPINPTLTWEPSSGATLYEYCFDTTNDGTCSNWLSAGTSTYANLNSLAFGVQHFWQVRASNTAGTAYANGGASAFWSFTTIQAGSESYLEPFHTDVFSSNTWTRSDTSVFVQTSKSLFHISADGGDNDHATRSTSLNLPVTLEARIRLVSGGINFRLPQISLVYGSSQLPISFSTGEGWIFKDPTYQTIKAPLAENHWVTIRAVIRSDGGDLYARHDGETEFTKVTSRAWSITLPITAIRISQPGDAVIDMDYMAVNFSPSFADVPGTHWAWQFIESMYKAGITVGCGTTPLSYCPEENITRAQMAILLERGLRGSAYIPPAATGTVFNDIPSSHWAAAWIEKLDADGITKGCGNGNFCPDAIVTRTEMAVFLLRASHGSNYNPPPANGYFSDVPTTYWAADWIEQLFNEGITTGCTPSTYCPGSQVTRAQMAVFLVRTFEIP